MAAQAVERSLVGHALIDALVIALVLGIAVRNALGVPLWAAAGAGFASKQVLEASIVLLGASVALGAIVEAGAALFGLVVLSVAGGLAFAWTVGHYVFGLHSRLAVLVGVGGSICGNSAIAAVAPAIDATAEDVAAAISISAVLGAAQILLLPLLVPGLDLTHYQYGVVAGISVYAVPQVVAAGFAVSGLSGEVATFVKLTRVLLLGPMILVLRLFHGGASAARAARPLAQRARTVLPWFIVGFLLLAALRTAEVISPEAGGHAQTVSKTLFIIAMAGLGLGVDLRAVRAVGGAVAATVLATMAFMLLVSIAGTSILGLTG
jgi:uncharacterized integral membrane protein (TIGR00698 family)